MPMRVEWGERFFMYRGEFPAALGETLEGLESKAFTRLQMCYQQGWGWGS
jgi:hypothetical protein